MKQRTITISTIVLVLVAIVGIVSAQNTPLGATDVTVERTTSVNISNYDPFEVPALAGNLTELSIVGISQTKVLARFLWKRNRYNNLRRRRGK
jgi:hypothetical protein